MSTPDSRRGSAAAAKADNGSLLRTLERLQGQRPHLQILILLLLLAFVITAVLAWQGFAANRAQREIVERTLNGYSESTVTRWREIVDGLAFNVLRLSFLPADHLLQRGEDPETVVAAIEFARHCNCDPASVVADFWLDLRGDVPAGRVAAPVASLGALRVALGADAGVRWMEDVRLGIRPLPGRDDLLIVFLLRDSPTEEPLQAFGQIVRVEVVERILAAAVENRDFLPLSLQRVLPVDSLFELRGAARGVEVYSTRHDYPARYATSAVTDNALAGVELTAIVNPAAIDVFIPGGLPPNRLPLLLALLALTASLTTTAVFLLRRETELTRLRSEFVASVSHELRTPLAQIRMFAETLMLGRTRSEAERRKSLEIIDQEARRLAHLVENVLLYAKSERRRTVIAPRPTPLGNEVLQAVESFRPFCRSRDSRIRCELESDVIANVDRFALRQVLLNLFDNALKYGPMGQEITVGLAVFDSSVRIWVDDEGPGIPSAHWNRVFDPFYRIAGEAERSVAGSGIGLAVVRELATLHGGRAWVEDAPGGGARVAIELPHAHVAHRPDPHIGAVA